MEVASKYILREDVYMKKLGLLLILSTFLLPEEMFISYLDSCVYIYPKYEIILF